MTLTRLIVGKRVAGLRSSEMVTISPFAPALHTTSVSSARLRAHSVPERLKLMFTGLEAATLNFNLAKGWTEKPCSCPGFNAKVSDFRCFHSHLELSWQKTLTNAANSIAAKHANFIDEQPSVNLRPWYEPQIVSDGLMA